jgi:hypothetical protein
LEQLKAWLAYEREEMAKYWAWSRYDKRTVGRKHGRYRYNKKQYEVHRDTAKRYAKMIREGIYDKCKAGSKRPRCVLGLAYTLARARFSPGATDDLKDAVTASQIIGMIANFKDIPAAASQSVVKLTEELVDGIIAQGIAPSSGTILDGIGKARELKMRQVGVAIWIHVEYDNCESTGRYNDWVKKERWHKCSATGRGRVPGADGFDYCDKEGIAGAIGKCMKEALNAVK